MGPKIVEVFYRAGLCERLMPGLQKPGSPSMYKILEMSYDSKDLGYYDKKPLKLTSDLVKDIKIDITPIPTVQKSDATKFFPQVSKPVKKPSSGLAYLLGVDDE